MCFSSEPPEKVDLNDKFEEIKIKIDDKNTLSFCYENNKNRKYNWNLKSKDIRKSMDSSSNTGENKEEINRLKSEKAEKERKINSLKEKIKDVDKKIKTLHDILKIDVSEQKYLKGLSQKINEEKNEKE